MTSGMLSAALAASSLAAPAKKKATAFYPADQAKRGIKVGCSVSLWTRGARATLSDALKGISAAGYEWAEADADHLLAYEDRIEEFRRLLARYKLGWITALFSASVLDSS